MPREGEWRVRSTLPSCQAVWRDIVVNKTTRAAYRTRDNVVVARACIPLLPTARPHAETRTFAINSRFGKLIASFAICGAGVGWRINVIWKRRMRGAISEKRKRGGKKQTVARRKEEWR